MNQEGDRMVLRRNGEFMEGCESWNIAKYCKKDKEIESISEWCDIPDRPSTLTEEVCTDPLIRKLRLAEKERNRAN